VGLPSFLLRELVSLQEIFLSKKPGLILSKHNTSKEGIFVPLEVTELFASKVGEKFSIFVF
jgi:hypothetical protein